MHPAYFETQFRVEVLPSTWPAEFVILSAFATTGSHWPKERNEEADRDLQYALQSRGIWMHRLIGYSPRSGHAEPSWAAEMHLISACELGLNFAQDALYHVVDDDLFVVQCQFPTRAIRVDSFRSRITQ